MAASGLNLPSAEVIDVGFREQLLKSVCVCVCMCDICVCGVYMYACGVYVMYVSTCNICECVCGWCI